MGSLTHRKPAAVSLGQDGALADRVPPHLVSLPYILKDAVDEESKEGAEGTASSRAAPQRGVPGSRSQLPSNGTVRFQPRTGIGKR